MNFLFKILLLFTVNYCFASISLKDRLNTLEKGDYIVTQHNTTYSLFAVSDLNKNKAEFIEISIPKNKIINKKFSWQKWIKSKAEGNTSCNVYEIDMKSGILLRCFSLSKKTFLKIEKTDNFFTKLLNLPLNKLAEDKRKKIGPPPQNEIDRRALWNPPMVINGQIQKNPKYEVYQTLWPKDDTPLSGKIIDLYFDAKACSVFPFWIQVSNGNIDVILKTIDSGKGLSFEEFLRLP